MSTAAGRARHLGSLPGRHAQGHGAARGNLQGGCRPHQVRVRVCMCALGSESVYGERACGGIRCPLVGRGIHRPPLSQNFSPPPRPREAQGSSRQALAGLMLALHETPGHVLVFRKTRTSVTPPVVTAQL